TADGRDAVAVSCRRRELVRRLRVTKLERRCAAAGRRASKVEEGDRRVSCACAAQADRPAQAGCGFHDPRHRGARLGPCGTNSAVEEAARGEGGKAVRQEFKAEGWKAGR